MSGKMIALCSLTKLMFTSQERCVPGDFIDSPEPLASIVFLYKLAIKKLQLTILDAGPDNLEDIGRCFEKLEIAIDLLIEYCVENH
jgi:hypothetical protein